MATIAHIAFGATLTAMMWRALAQEWPDQLGDPAVAAALRIVFPLAAAAGSALSVAAGLVGADTRRALRHDAASALALFVGLFVIALGPIPRDVIGLVVVLVLVARLLPAACLVVRSGAPPVFIFALCFAAYAGLGAWRVASSLPLGDQVFYLLAADRVAHGDFDARIDEGRFFRVLGIPPTPSDTATHVVNAPAGPRLIQGYAFPALLAPGWVAAGELGATLIVALFAAWTAMQTWLLLGELLPGSRVARDAHLSERHRRRRDRDRIPPCIHGATPTPAPRGARARRDRVPQSARRAHRLRARAVRGRVRTTGAHALRRRCGDRGRRVGRRRRRRLRHPDPVRGLYRRSRGTVRRSALDVHLPALGRTARDAVRSHLRYRRRRAVALPRGARRRRRAPPRRATPAARRDRARCQPCRALALPLLGGRLCTARALLRRRAAARRTVPRVRPCALRRDRAPRRRSRADRDRRPRHGRVRGRAHRGAQHGVRRAAADDLRFDVRGKSHRLAAVVPTDDTGLVRRRVSAPRGRARARCRAALAGPACEDRMTQQLTVFAIGNAIALAWTVFAVSQPWVGSYPDDVPRTIAQRFVPFALLLVALGTALVAVALRDGERPALLRRHFALYLVVPVVLFVLSRGEDVLNGQVGAVYLLAVALWTAHALQALWHVVGNLEDRRAALLLGAIVLVPYLVLMPYHRAVIPTASDEPHYLVIVQSLLADRDLDLTNQYDSEVYRAYYPDRLPDRHIIQVGEAQFPIRDLGLPLVAAVPFAMGGRLGVEALMCLVGAALAAQLYLASRDLGIAHRPALVASSLAALTHPVLTYTTQIYPELLAALAFVSAARLVRRGAATSTRDLAVASALLGTLPWLSTRATLIALGAGLVLAY